MSSGPTAEVPQQPADPQGLVLTGEGVVLREWRPADVEHLPDLFDDPEVDRWTPLESPFGLDAARRYLDRAREGRQSGRSVQLAVTLDSERPLGEVLLFPRSASSGEVGYVIGPAHRGQHLATRAVRLLVAHASTQYATLQLRIGPGNAASEAVATACGFTRTARPLERLEQKGVLIDLATWERRS